MGRASINRAQVTQAINLTCACRRTSKSLGRDQLLCDGLYCAVLLVALEQMNKGLCCIVCISPGCDMGNMHAKFQYQQTLQGYIL